MAPRQPPCLQHVAPVRSSRCVKMRGQEILAMTRGFELPGGVPFSLGPSFAPEPTIPERLGYEATGGASGGGDRGARTTNVISVKSVFGGWLCREYW